jgi:hypothetical protein
VVEFGESEWGLAKLAVLFLGVRKPLHQAVLVNELDAPAAFAGIEQRLFARALPSAYSTGILFIHTLPPRASICSIGRVVHDIGKGGASWIIGEDVC